jgi:hypothetical protein
MYILGPPGARLQLRRSSGLWGVLLLLSALMLRVGADTKILAPDVGIRSRSSYSRLRENFPDSVDFVFPNPDRVLGDLRTRISVRRACRGPERVSLHSDEPQERRLDDVPSNSNSKTWLHLRGFCGEFNRRRSRLQTSCRESAAFCVLPIGERTFPYPSEAFRFPRSMIE